MAIEEVVEANPRCLPMPMAIEATLGVTTCFETFKVIDVKHIHLNPV